MENKKLDIFNEKNIKKFKNNIKYVKNENNWNEKLFKSKLEYIKKYSNQTAENLNLFKRFLDLINKKYQNIQFEIQWNGKILIYNNDINDTFEFSNVWKLSDFLDNYDSLNIWK